LGGVEVRGQIDSRPTGFSSPPSAGGGDDALGTSRAHRIYGVSAGADGVFRVDGVGKPLATAAELLRRKLGVPISYEDQRWATLEEIRVGTMDVVVPTSALARDAARPAEVIRRTLDSHRRFQNAGTYTLVEFGESEYSIVPSFEVDVSGREAGYRAPLD